MKVIGFDYDGTLTNIEPEKAKAFGDTVFREWNADEVRAAAYWLQKGGTSRRYKFDYVYRQQYGKELPDDVYKKVEGKFSYLLKDKYYSYIKLLPGIMKIIKFCRENFDYLFISSGIPTEEIKYLVKKNKIDKYFDSIYGTDDRYKTKMDHFEEIRRKLNPSVFIFVGDSMEDMKMAIASGMVAIGITTNHSEEELSEAGANYVCNLKTCQSVLANLR